MFPRFMHPMFADRTDAGRRLAERLVHLKDRKPVVLALPRGGVPVAAAIAEALDAPLDLVMVRKIGAPTQPELAVGAVVDGIRPRTVLNADIVESLQISETYIAAETQRQLREIERRRKLYLGDRKPVAVRGNSIIIVDDGIATGASIRAALEAMATEGTAWRAVAAPVASLEAAELVRRSCDETVFLSTPADFGSIGAFYDDFHQLTDAEVTDLMGQTRSPDDRAR